MESVTILDDVMAFASMLAIFVLALVQLVKKSIKLPSNAVPVVGFMIGLLIGVAAYPFTELDVVLVYGLVALLAYLRRGCLSYSSSSVQE